MDFDQSLDCKGLSCPMPIIKLSKAMKGLESGKVLQMIGTDPGSKTDIPAWCTKTGNEFLSMEEADGETKFYIKKS
ncbi:MAG: hypothetical protein GQ534_01210 [Candidatus Delongbacteria bacterium]|nr:hypothetical protein [Candidatus Delongbacteria bacterium]